MLETIKGQNNTGVFYYWIKRLLEKCKFSSHLQTQAILVYFLKKKKKDQTGKESRIFHYNYRWGKAKT